MHTYVHTYMYRKCHYSLTLFVSTDRGSPRNVKATSIVPASLRVQWEPPSDIQKGSITGYVIQYSRIGSNDEKTINMRGETTEYTIQNLVAFEGYSVRVATIKDNKTFPFSDDVVENAGEDSKLCM